MEENSITIKKIPLDMLLGVLSNLYEQGVDFVDIVGNTGTTQDNLGISFQQDYISDENVDVNQIKYPEISFKKNKPLPPSEPQLPPLTKFNEDDLNNLI